MSTKATGRAAQLAALARHRGGTQFQPLDAASPTVLLQAKVSEEQRDRLDAAAQSRGLTRSEAVRAAIQSWLDADERRVRVD